MKSNLPGLDMMALWTALASLSFSTAVQGTPANKAAFSRHYDHFLAQTLNNCSACHLPSANKNPESLDEFPHNPYGARLRLVGKELAEAGKAREIPARVELVAGE